MHLGTELAGRFPGFTSPVKTAILTTVKPINAMSNETKANERDRKEIMLAFDALTARLDSLDGMYAWNDEIDMVREALEKAGY